MSRTRYPRVSAVRSRKDLKAALRRLFAAWLVVLTASLLFILLAEPLVGVAFGRQYSAAVPMAQILALQFPIVTAYVPIVLVFPFIGRLRWQIELTVVLLVSELLILALSKGVLPLLQLHLPSRRSWAQCTWRSDSRNSTQLAMSTVGP